MTEEEKPKDVTTEEQKAKKRKERLEQNRISARESRKRKKTMIEELQRTGTNTNVALIWSCWRD